MKIHIKQEGVQNLKVLVDTNICGGCGLCASECPCKAIIIREFPEIDYDLCTGCGICVESCPLRAMALE
ncbi:MAG: ferredoxin [Spirochaetae bacterium HGW-Spirochaetae-1]|nr:MAG: ferredoxin [Spirochaetae bacterium HGW-Spirochaetae-1]